jgi:hypothetical protein
VSGSFAALVSASRIRSSTTQPRAYQARALPLSNQPVSVIYPTRRALFNVDRHGVGPFANFERAMPCGGCCC